LFKPKPGICQAFTFLSPSVKISFHPIRLLQKATVEFGCTAQGDGAQGSAETILKQVQYRVQDKFTTEDEQN
jgi:hypothetical protein